MKFLLSLPLLVATVVGIALTANLQMREPEAAEFPELVAATGNGPVAPAIGPAFRPAADQPDAGDDLLAGFDPAALAGGTRADAPAPVPARHDSKTPADRLAENSLEAIDRAGEDPSGARRAIDRLAGARDQRAYDTLVEALRRLEDPELRHDVLLHLETMDDQDIEALLSLGEALAGDPESLERLAGLIGRELAAAGPVDRAAHLSRAGSGATGRLAERVLRRADARATIASGDAGLSPGETASLLLELASDDPAAAARLEELLLSAADPAARIEVLESILESPEAPGDDVLRQLLASDGSPDVRALAALSLTDTDQVESLAAISSVLASDPDPTVRAAAADAAAAAGTEKMSLSLLDSLHNDPSDEVRAHAGRALVAHYLLDGPPDAPTLDSIESGLRTIVDRGLADEASDVARSGLQLLSKLRQTS